MLGQWSLWEAPFKMLDVALPCPAAASNSGVFTLLLIEL